MPRDGRLLPVKSSFFVSCRNKAVINIDWYSCRITSIRIRICGIKLTVGNWKIFLHNTKGTPGCSAGNSR